VKSAVVLFNLGGPDSLDAVRPFLFNLFNDPAIIALPGLIRRPLAALIAGRRAPVARAIYARMGGGSPLLPNTEAQARALEGALGPDHRCFIAMRYWHPLTEAAAREVAAWRPDRVLLVPLYPQYSSTTTASSLAAWRHAAAAAGIAAPTRTLCCYPREAGFVASVAAAVQGALQEAGAARPRVLFSAHGLPEKIVRGGDPYRWQVERTVAAILAAVGVPDLDYSICYQSRVGPLAWIGPATDAEIRRAGADRVPVIVVPVAFVSEHSETLVELDIEYRHLAEASGVPSYRRLPTVGAAAPFIRGLAERIRALAAGEAPLCSGEGGRICPAEFGRCAFVAAPP
jgi:protoporphyrin/coproporphyrin ferrochelatase